MQRIALLSVHTCPLLQPGAGWAGGMNVYVDELARSLARSGVRVDVFTRRHSREVPDTVTVEERFTLHHVEAGPAREMDPRRTHRFLGVFADRVIDELRHMPDVSLLHSHYWLSGWAGLRIKGSTGLPLVQSFHTLGRTKDRNRRSDTPPAALLRLATEEEVIGGADRIIASTEAEREDLIAHYDSDPASICVAPPGVDHDLFTPGLRDMARVRMGWPDVPTLLFVGRVQPTKGPDVALETFLQIKDEISSARLVVLGSAAGSEGVQEMERLQARVKEADAIDRVTFAEPIPHREMADVYRASDLVLVPSRSESFGLVAAEAQASGVPVIAARADGLAHVVPPGSGGLLVDGWDPDDWAEAALGVLRSPEISSMLAEQGPRHSECYSWDWAVERIVDIYEDVS